MRRRWGRVGVVAGAVLVTVALGACGGDDGSGAATSAPSGTATGPSGTTTPSTPSPTPSDEEEGGPVPTSSAAVTEEGLPQQQTAVLAAIRTGAHEGYDRVVFEFDGPIGGYAVSPADEITEDPSDLPVELDGAAFLQVVAHGATLDNAFQVTEGVEPRTYVGPLRLTPALESVLDLNNAGDFEAVLSYGIGLDAAHPFSVMLLEDPTRLVVDVAH